MISVRRGLTRFSQEVLFGLSLWVFAYWVVGLRRAGTFVWPPVSPERLLRGEALTPFQYRVLTVWIARVFVPWTTSVRTAFLLVDGLSAVALVLAFRLHLQALWTPANARPSQHDRARTLALLCCPLIAAMIPFQYVLLGEVLGQRRYVYYPWDIAGAFGFMLCVTLLRAQRWRWFYPCFVLATLARETTAFIPLLLLFVAPPELSPRRLLGHLGAQGALWLATKAALYALYRHNPGQGAWEDTLWENLINMGQPATLLRVAGCFAFLWLPTVFMARYIDDRFTRRALWLLPVWFVAMLRVGNLYELRIFGELMTIVLPAWLVALRGVLRTLDAEDNGEASPAA